MPGLLTVIASWLLALFKRLGKHDAATQVAEEANRAARKSAETARSTTSTLDQELAHVQDATDADRSRVRIADSLRNLESIVNGAIDRANDRMP